MQEAKSRAGKAGALALRMEPHVGRRYDEDSVSAWVRGQAVPPADALLAAAKVTGVSLDGFLGDEQTHRDAEVRELHQELSALRQEYDDFHAAVIEAFSHAGLPFNAASSVPAESRQATRRASTG
jgi:transcriptional regulator with XRE-family HTH domain